MIFKINRKSIVLATIIAILGLCLPDQDISAQTRQPSSTPDSPKDEVDHRFGIVEAFWKADDAAELEVGWDRILFYWNEIQPTGPDDWNTLHVLEEWLDEARQQDRVVLGLLKNTPAWATDAEPFSGVPRGLYLPVDDPENLWAGYVRKVVEYYAPLDVHHWIIWNEPEINAGVYGHEFSGSTKDYYQLLKVAYQVAKTHDPEAVIHLAGWSYWHDPNWLGDFLQVAKADPEGQANHYFFDVITLHIYFRVETVEELVEETWAIQKRYGLQKPIWINETNASPNLDPLWPVERPNFQVDLDQQAWFIVQAHALGFGANSTSIGIYKLLDVLLPEGGESFGILRPDGSQRPAFDAYRTTIRYLKDFTYPVGRQQEGNFYAFSFKRPASVTRILWARNATDLILRVPALSDEALIVSALGDQAYSVRAYNGFYRIRLRGARCTPECEIGGPPVFLVEKVSAALNIEAIATIAPDTAILATATPSPTPSPTTDFRDGAAETAPATEQQGSPTPTSSPEPTTTLTAVPTTTPSSTMTPSPTATATPELAIAEAIVDDLSAATVAGGSTNGNITPSSSNLTMSESRNYATSTWLFLGAAVLLGGLLALIAARRHGS